MKDNAVAEALAKKLDDLAEAHATGDFMRECWMHRRTIIAALKASPANGPQRCPNCHTVFEQIYDVDTHLAALKAQRVDEGGVS